MRSSRDRRSPVARSLRTLTLSAVSSSRWLPRLRCETVFKDLMAMKVAEFKVHKEDLRTSGVPPTLKNACV